MMSDQVATIKNVAKLTKNVIKFIMHFCRQLLFNKRNSYQQFQFSLDNHCIPRVHPLKLIINRIRFLLVDKIRNIVQTKKLNAR